MMTLYQGNHDKKIELSMHKHDSVKLASNCICHNDEKKKDSNLLTKAKF